MTVGRYAVVDGRGLVVNNVSQTDVAQFESVRYAVMRITPFPGPVHILRNKEH